MSAPAFAQHAKNGTLVANYPSQWITKQILTSRGNEPLEVEWNSDCPFGGLRLAEGTVVWNVFLKWIVASVFEGSLY